MCTVIKSKSPLRIHRSIQCTMYESRRDNQSIAQLMKTRWHFKNSYKFSHNSSTDSNETLQCKNLCSIREWFCIIFSNRPNDAIAASFNGCQKLYFTLFAPYLINKHRKNYTLQCSKRDHYLFYLKKAQKVIY